MTEYTLAQVIDKFGRNRNLKFKYVAEEPYRTDEGAVIALDKEGYIVNQEGEPILSNFSLGSKFRLINAPVDRMTAFKAFLEGKSICCEYKDTRRCYKPKEKLMLEDNDRFAISVLEILYGKWFIGED